MNLNFKNNLEREKTMQEFKGLGSIVYLVKDGDILEIKLTDLVSKECKEHGGIEFHYFSSDARKSFFVLVTVKSNGSLELKSNAFLEKKDAENYLNMVA